MKPAFRPIARRLLRSAAAAMCLLSLVLCVVTCWLWLRSRGGDAYVASLTSPQRTYELRSRDGRLSVLRIEGRRPANPGSLLFSDSAVALVLVQQAPPPVVKSGFAGVEVERGPLNALEGAPTLVTSDASFTLLSSVGPQTLVNGNSPRLTLQGTNVVGGEVAVDRLVSGGVGSSVVAVPPPVQPASRVTAPYRLLAAATAALPALWMALAARGAWSARRVARRRRAGQCADCGYDLRGTPGADRCPECGRRVTADARATSAPA